MESDSFGAPLQHQTLTEKSKSLFSEEKMEDATFETDINDGARPPPELNFDSKDKEGVDCIFEDKAFEDLSSVLQIQTDKLDVENNDKELEKVLSEPK